MPSFNLSQPIDSKGNITDWSLFIDNCPYKPMCRQFPKSGGEILAKVRFSGCGTGLCAASKSPLEGDLYLFTAHHYNAAHLP